MPIYSNNFSELLWPGLREVYGLEYAQYAEEYSRYMAIESSSKSKEEDQSMTGFGLVPTKASGEAISYDDAYQGYKKTYTHATYGMGFMVTREMYEDDQYRKIKGLPKALARSVRHTIEILAAQLLNNAFTSGLGGDGVYMCATNHPLIGGGTYSNKLAVDADLDVTSYEQAGIDIQSFVDDRGLKMAAKKKVLLISPSLEFTAKQMLKSSQLPGSANNDINPAQGDIEYVVCHWMTDADAWFIITDVPNGLNFFWRRRPEFTEDNDWETENAKFKTTFRCSMGWTDPRGIFGSAGA